MFWLSCWGVGGEKREGRRQETTSWHSFSFLFGVLPLLSLSHPLSLTVAALSTTASATSTAPRVPPLAASSAALAVSASISGLELSVRPVSLELKSSRFGKGGGGAMTVMMMMAAAARWQLRA